MIQCDACGKNIIEGYARYCPRCQRPFSHHLKQRQDSLLNQLADLRDVANKLGMYDAADFIRNQIEQSRERR